MFDATRVDQLLSFSLEPCQVLGIGIQSYHNP